MNIKKDRLGETHTMKNGSACKIIKYDSSTKVVVKFENGHKTICEYGNLKRGLVSDCHKESNVSMDKINCDKNSKSFKTWTTMNARVIYNKSNDKIQPTYKDCTICEEWKQYSIFDEWFNENYYEIELEEMHLDKDILIKGNKVYSPETCIFVPRKINQLFVKRDKSRGIYPIGVDYNKSRHRFRAKCSNGVKQVIIGYYITPKEAFNIYKIFKENHIKQVAYEYKDRIPQKLYDAMYKYEVEITD